MDVERSVAASAGHLRISGHPRKEKLKEVKARLNFEGYSGRNSKIQEVSQHSESRTPNVKGEHRRGRNSRRSCIMSRILERTSVFSRIRHDRSESPRHKLVGKGRRDVGVFNRPRGKEKSASVQSESRYQSSHSGRMEFVPRKRHYEGTCSRKTQMLFESEDNRGDTGSQNQKSKEDHLKIFQAAVKVERWAMPTWCHMFNSTLAGSARVWFDDLPLKFVDSYNDLKKAFLANFLQQKKCIKDPVENHHIKQRGGESTEDFMQIFNVESRHVKGASECMRISRFMHRITNPELIKRLHDNIPKLVDEMTRVTTTFLRGEVAASNQEILAFDKDKCKTPPPKTTPFEKRINNKFVSSTRNKNRGCGAFNLYMDEICGGEITISVQLDHRKARGEKNSNSPVISSQNVKIPSSRRNTHYTKQQDNHTQMHDGVPGHLAEHRLNVREGCLPVRQKKRSQAPARNKEEVAKLIDAGVMKEVYYHSWLSNPVMVKKHDDSWRMCVDFKDLNKACPKDGYWKNAGATYQQLVDKAFQKQIGRNLKVYMDDLVIKSRTEQEITRDIKETFRTLREINMKLNPKKCTFGVEEGMFLGYKSAEKSLPFFNALKKCTKKSDFQWTAEVKAAFKQMKKLIAWFPTLTAPMKKEELIVYITAAREAVSELLITE
nr:hypothetical protein [Tanacetum cinerariifolium]